MSHNRLARPLVSERLPSSAGAAVSLGAFVWVPVALVPATGFSAVQQSIYRAAFAEAHAVCRPSWLERDVLGVWN